MKTHLLRLLFAALIASVPALPLAAQSPSGGACYIDYKAKKDGGALRLHYGVMEMPPGACAPGPARSEAARRLATDGWVLLAVMSAFGEDGLEERRDSAGPYFLRY